jgi:hypothetical protein
MTEQWQELKETITEMRDNGGTGTQQEVCKFLANYMEILEKQMQQPCEDCISRQAAIDAIYGCYIGGKEAVENSDRFDHYADGIYESVEAIKDLPSVTPQSKISHWINLEKTKYKGQVLPFWGRYECSKCGGHGEGTFNYCPNCGAKMTESEEE